MARLALHSHVSVFSILLTLLLPFSSQVGEELPHPRHVYQPAGDAAKPQHDSRQHHGGPHTANGNTRGVFRWCHKSDLRDGDFQKPPPMSVTIHHLEAPDHVMLKGSAF